jgi:sarcosine oxidase
VSTHYDVIVAGVGAMGSSALYHMAKIGLKVCGVERFIPGHDRGSSHGDSRIVRKAYFLDPSYVPLMHRSYEVMAEIEARRNQKLFHNIGLLSAGVINSEFHRGMEKCFATHSLPHNRWNVDEARQHYPHIRLPEDSVIYFDHTGGYANPEAVVRAQVQCAEEEGAQILTGTRLLSWQAGRDGVEVRTNERTLKAEKLVLTTGAWIIPELAKLGVTMTLKRKVQVWYEMTDITPFRPEVCPVFILKNRGGDFYGFPTLDGRTVKTAETSGGTDLISADEQHGELLPSDHENLTRFMHNTFGDLTGRPVAHKECLQTFTNDQNFIIDYHPHNSRVILCSPCSGHGFKFAPVMGELLRDLIQDCPPSLDIKLFRISRFSSVL